MSFACRHKKFHVGHSFRMQLQCRVVPTFDHPTIERTGNLLTATSTELQGEWEFDHIVWPSESEETLLSQMHEHLFDNLDVSIPDDIATGGIRSFLVLGARRSGKTTSLFAQPKSEEGLFDRFAKTFQDYVFSQGDVKASIGILRLFHGGCEDILHQSTRVRAWRETDLEAALCLISPDENIFFWMNRIQSYSHPDPTYSYVYRITAAREGSSHMTEWRFFDWNVRWGDLSRCHWVRSANLNGFKRCLQQRIEGKFVPIRDSPLTILLRKHLEERKAEDTGFSFLHCIVTLSANTDVQELTPLLEFCKLLHEFRFATASRKKSARKINI